MSEIRVVSAFHPSVNSSTRSTPLRPEEQDRGRRLLSFPLYLPIFARPPLLLQVSRLPHPTTPRQLLSTPSIPPLLAPLESTPPSLPSLHSLIPLLLANHSHRPRLHRISRITPTSLANERAKARSSTARTASQPTVLSPSASVERASPSAAPSRMVEESSQLQPRPLVRILPSLAQTAVSKNSSPQPLPFPPYHLSDHLHLPYIPQPRPPLSTLSRRHRLRARPVPPVNKLLSPPLPHPLLLPFHRRSQPHRKASLRAASSARPATPLSLGRTT